MNIYLCGMIGSGKTAVGTLLADRLGRPFLDLDREMDRELGRSFHELVREKGWLAFRELEYTICKRFAAMKNSVIALGGGTVRYEWNRDILSGSGIRILLQADLGVLADRVRRADRPRVNAGTSLEADLRKIWEEHSGLYLNFADVVYHTDVGRSVEEETEDVLDILRARGLLDRQHPAAEGE
ncbi:MAG TPA: shikimate kinase [Thermodesulfobacteriota bacterium]|nr:shikimate kinase [Thermodesulfobacteriota bacterium]